MDRDLTIMIYGAIMGVAGSLLTSIVSALFQLWLERREHERRQHEERRHGLQHIHLPTNEEVIRFSASRSDDPAPEEPRKTAPAGSIALSTFVGGVLVYQTNDLMLGFAFAFMLAFLMTRRMIRALRR
jgi:predicted PurR-regulated permease PerM